MTRIRLIDMIIRSLSTNHNDYIVGTCNNHELLLRIMCCIEQYIHELRGHKRTHNENYYIEICFASFDDTSVHSCTYILLIKK